MKKKGKSEKPFYVIVGNSVAGIAALEAIRETDRVQPAAIIDREARHVYSRPLISYYLEGKADEALMRLRPGGFYENMRARAMLGVEVKAVEPRRRHLLISGGRRIGYGELLLAVGAEPVVPRIRGLEGTGTFSFIRWEDAASLKKSVRARSRALVLGAGLIGIKAAEALKALGARVTLVEIADRPLPSVLDAASGRIVAAHIRKSGVRLLLSTAVEEVRRRAGRIVSAVTSKGEEIPCACVVVAAGVRPRLALPRSAGLKTRRGIVVNRRMETSVPHIWAAGDVTEASALGGGRRNIPVWTLAYEQGSVAGANMAGGRCLYRPGTQMNSIEVFGLPVITLGESSGDGEGRETFVSRARRGPGYRKIIIRNNRIKGAVFVGEIERAGIICGLLRDGADVGAFKSELLSENFGYIYVPREYRAKHIAPLEV